MEGVSSHRLDYNDFNEVYIECDRLSAQWEEIGVYLRAPRHIISNIQADRTNVSGRLSELLDQWLKRWSKEQVFPSWRVLCEAVARVDLSLAEKIARGHQCTCPECHVPSKDGGIDVSQELAIKTKQTRKETQITPAHLRKHHGQLCKVLNTSEDTLHTFANELFAEKFISEETKISAIRQGGQKGANALLDHVSLKIDMNPRHLPTLIRIMESIELLNDVVKRMRGEEDDTNEIDAGGQERAHHSEARRTNTVSCDMESDSELPSSSEANFEPQPSDDPDSDPPYYNGDQQMPNVSDKVESSPNGSGREERQEEKRKRCSSYFIFSLG